MRLVPVHEAVGLALSHDLTRVIPGVFKGPAFKKGHIVCLEDIPLLLDMGKEHIYVLDTPGILHEDEAAVRLARAAAGEGLFMSGPAEGRVNIIADRSGLLKVNVKALLEINKINQIVFSTLHGDQFVAKGKIVAGTRVIPLLIDQVKIEEAERISAIARPLMMVKKLQTLKVGLIVTGSEVYRGRIPDGFGPVVAKKIEAMGSCILKRLSVSDDKEMIARAISRLINEGAQMVVATGGMSVDPDDRTPGGIRAAGGQVVSYGAPVLPGAMFMLAYLGDIPVLGLPACVMHSPATVFDILLPRLLAGERVERKDIIELGHGGLCRQCPACYFPDCGFGKGCT